MIGIYETIEDIIADLESDKRRFSNSDATAIASRLKEARRREQGNQAAALNTLREIRDDVLDMVRECRSEDPDSYAHGLLLSIGGACDMALREPMRNCDRYSHDEALAAWAAEKENAGNGCFDEWLYHTARETR